MSEMTPEEFVKTIGSKEILYIAIGSAGHMARVTNGKHVIDPMYNQQYPSCIQKIKELTNSKINIMLVDPMIESPPFIAKNKSASVVSNILNKLGKGWYACGNLYTNSTDKMRVLSVNQAVTYVGCDERKGETNITGFLENVNTMAMKDNWFVVVHDFSGRTINHLAYYFDGMLKGHHEHIIYGLGYRNEYGCYIDLTQEQSQFAIIDSDTCKVFNPFGNSVEANRIVYNESKDVIIKSAIKTYMKHKMENFKNNIVGTYRRLLLPNSVDIIDPKEFRFAETKYNVNISEISNSDRIKLYIDIVINELNDIFIFHKSDAENKGEINDYVRNMLEIETNPYKISAYLLGLVKDIELK